MKKILALLVISIVGVTTAYYFGFFSKNNETRNQNVVAVTIFPLADITRNIAKNELTVKQILPNGASPHIFDPNPSDLAAISEAKAIYAIGHGLDQWSNTIATANEIPIIVVDRDITLRETSLIEEDDDSEHSDGTDPHYWLSIPNAKTIATTITEDLKLRFPDKATIFENNLSAYLRELNDADTQIRAILSGIKNRNIVTFHDAWFYFAEEYGLTVIATAEPAPGVEPPPRYLSLLDEAITQAKVNTIYSEPSLSVDPILSFAKDKNLNIAVIDPIGGVDTNSYIDTMRKNAETIRDNQN